MKIGVVTFPGSLDDHDAHRAVRVAGALPRLGFNQFTAVRQGKRFVLTVEGEVTDQVLAAAREAAATMLSNPVIEDVVSVRAVSPAAEAQAVTSQPAESRA